jgi:hypothetical protein
MLLSLDHVGSRDVSLLVWLESTDNTTFSAVQEMCKGVKLVSSVFPMDVGNVTNQTSVLSPPLTEAYVYRRYDFMKFWGIHDSTSRARSRHYILNVDLDVIFLQPLLEVWKEGCSKLAESPSAFFVGGREGLETSNIHPG